MERDSDKIFLARPINTYDLEHCELEVVVVVVVAVALAKVPIKGRGR